MATFTMELNEVLKIERDFEDEVLAEYPIFNEKYRPALNKKIIDHFWNMEIGQESISLFKLQFRRKMNEIMPLYNQHYLASEMKYDPLETIGIEAVSDTKARAGMTGRTESKADGETLNESDSESKSRAVSSELPQVALSENGDYATAATDNISTTKNTATAVQSQESSDTSQTDTTQEGNSASRTQGFSGNRALLMMQYRQSLVNVDMLVIEQLESLFMALWSNGDEFSPNERFPYYGYYF